jgi:N-formylglutamate deformylase
MKVVTLHRGTAPLLISLPHDGIALPAEMAERMTDSAKRVPDTDWFVSRLYSFAESLDASIIVPTYSRYVVDLNRPPDDLSLYPGQNTTGLCPTVQFSGEPVYLPGEEPTPAEIAQRVDSFWRPYHDALAKELKRLHATHGRVLLWEGHSIKSQVPFLFEGRLPDINVGTAGGSSCEAATQARIERVLTAQSRYSWVSNGRFKGGHITRHYGRPADGIEAVQLELVQSNYMDEALGNYDSAKAAQTQDVLESLVRAALSATAA